MRLRRRFAPTLFLMLVCSCAPTTPEAPPEALATQGAEELPPAPTAEAVPAPPPATELPPAAAQPAPAMPQFAAVVINKVKDFDQWKTAFDSHADARKQAGIVAHGLMRGTDDDKVVVVYLPAIDADKLQAFVASPELKERMKSAGVQGKPTIYVFKSVEEKMAPPRSAPFGAVVAYDTKDFDAFQKAVQEQADARASAGVTGYALGQSLDKKNGAYLYLQSADAAQLKKYIGAKETKQALAKAGVHGNPNVTVFKEGEMTAYR